MPGARNSSRTIAGYHADGPGGIPRAELRQIASQKKGPTAVEVIDAGPDISGPEFDPVFEEIERIRRDPTLQKAREFDL